MMMAMTIRVMATPTTTMTIMPRVVIMITKIMGMATTIEGTSSRALLDLG